MEQNSLEVANNELSHMFKVIDGSCNLELVEKMVDELSIEAKECLIYHYHLAEYASFGLQSDDILVFKNGLVVKDIVMQYILGDVSYINLNKEDGDYHFQQVVVKKCKKIMNSWQDVSVGIDIKKSIERYEAKKVRLGENAIVFLLRDLGNFANLYRKNHVFSNRSWNNPSELDKLFQESLVFIEELENEEKDSLSKYLVEFLKDYEDIDNMMNINIVGSLVMLAENGGRSIIDKVFERVISRLETASQKNDAVMTFRQVIESDDYVHSNNWARQYIGEIVSKIKSYEECNDNFITYAESDKRLEILVNSQELWTMLVMHWMGVDLSDEKKEQLENFKEIFGNFKEWEELRLRKTWWYKINVPECYYFLIQVGLIVQDYVKEVIPRSNFVMHAGVHDLKIYLDTKAESFTDVKNIMKKMMANPWFESTEVWEAKRESVLTEYLMEKDLEKEKQRVERSVIQVKKW